jgi:UDP-N-acetylmuramyl-tripeptide synthetase
VEISSAGVKFNLKYTDRQIPVKLKLTGLFNVYNSLAAIAVGLVEGISIEGIIASLEKIAGIPGRFESVNGGNDYTVIVDYSHTPDSLENCLKTAKELARGRIITVFGCGGDRDRTKRPLMGEVAGRYSDIAIVTSDNPRCEEPEAIIDEIIPGLEKGPIAKPYLRITDRREAIFRAVQEAKSGDIIIIAGKGHEDYQLIGKQVLHFDDREVAQEALRQAGKWEEK